jgi:GGDEF domain-containing protein
VRSRECDDALTVCVRAVFASRSWLRESYSGGVVDDRRSPAWGYPPSRPFVLLAVYFGISVLQLAAVAARPPFPDTPVRELWILTGLSVVLGLAVGAAWLRQAPAALPVLVAGGMLVPAASAAVSVGGQGQLVSGFYLAVLGMYSGYFLSRHAVMILIILATVTYGAALLIDWRLDSPAYVLAVVVLVDGVTLLVSSLVQRLRAQAVLDPLTGLLNRRGLVAGVDALHAMDVRQHHVTTIVQIDLDGFKQYNDSHGHDAGDRLLADLARHWNGVLRRSDLLARTDGDEFVLILPATDRAEADALIDRMRLADPFGWSAGIVEWRQGEPFEDALTRADEEMYRNKVRSR